MRDRKEAIIDFETFKKHGYNHGYLPSSWSIEMAIQALKQEPILEKIFYIVHPLSIMSTDKLEHEAIMQIAEMLEPLYLLESEDKE